MDLIDKRFPEININYYPYFIYELKSLNENLIKLPNKFKNIYYISLNGTNILNDKIYINNYISDVKDQLITLQIKLINLSIIECDNKMHIINNHIFDIKNYILTLQTKIKEKLIISENDENNLSIINDENNLSIINDEKNLSIINDENNLSIINYETNGIETLDMIGNDIDFIGNNIDFLGNDIDFLGNIDFIGNDAESIEIDAEFMEMILNL